MNAAFLVLAGLSGLLNHYFVRYKQGRTTSTFKEYLLGDLGSTLSSVTANLTSSVGMYLALPDDIGGKMLIGAIYASYAAGYAFDSMLNKDPNPSIPVVKEPAQDQKIATHNTVASEIKHEINNKSLEDVINSDNAL